MRVRIRSSASLNVPPGKVVEAIVFTLEIMNYESGRTKTANIENPTFNGALGTRDKTKHLEVTPHFCTKTRATLAGLIIPCRFGGWVARFRDRPARQNALTSL